MTNKYPPSLLELTFMTKPLRASKKLRKVSFPSPVVTGAAPQPEYTQPTPVVTNRYIQSVYPQRCPSATSSTIATAGTDEELDKLASAPTKGKMSSTDSEVPQWTIHEDRTICLMKAADSTWGEIGAKLNRGKRECKHHYYLIGCRAKELGITVERLTKMYLDDVEAEKKAEMKAKRKAKAKAEKKQKEQVTTDSDTEDEDEESDEDASKRSKKYKKKSKIQAKHKAKSQHKGKAYKKKAPSTPSTSEASSTSESSSSSSSSSEEEYDHAAEIQASRRYQYDNMFSWMYPDQKRLRPDQFYSESDCRVLAGLEARYRANKWLHIQADFYNATGRMVEGEILKAKFYQ
ncbi:hypothetical protein GGR57DRAFT_60558 [Xylariaceae sp. FL1272]|nr:hypothetical protein GGR57DRAFT_60558 [Xylariaceae sp. FL1272]